MARTNSWFTRVDERLSALEKHSHEPFDFTHLIGRIERIEEAIKLYPAVDVAAIIRRGLNDGLLIQTGPDTFQATQPVVIEYDDIRPANQADRPSEGPGRSEPAGDSARLEE